MNMNHFCCIFIDKMIKNRVMVKHAKKIGNAHAIVCRPSANQKSVFEKTLSTNRKWKNRHYLSNKWLQKTFLKVSLDQNSYVSSNANWVNCYSQLLIGTFKIYTYFLFYFVFLLHEWLFHCVFLLLFILYDGFQNNFETS